MKLLFDLNLSTKLVRLLKEDFPESSHVFSAKVDSIDDLEIYYYARREGYIVVTMDKDFAELSFQRGAPPKVIWLRSGNLRTMQVVELLIKAKSTIESLEQSSDKNLLELF